MIHSSLRYALYILQSSLTEIQLQRTSNSHISKSTREVWKSLLVVLLYMLALDVWLHFFHINALNEYQVWKEDSFTPLQMFTLAYWMLNFMYMKFLIIWKFFSVFANLDGLEVPNNMLRYSSYTSPLTCTFIHCLHAPPFIAYMHLHSLLTCTFACCSRAPPFTVYLLT
jgi:hypothetical protein